MKTHLLLATVVAMMFSLFPSPSTAQNPTAGTRVVVVDIAVVMENNKKFKAKLEGIQTEIDAFDDTLDAKREEVKAKVEELRGYKAGSAAYSSLEQEIAQIQSDVSVQMQIKRKSVLMKEAQVFYDSYNEVISHIKSFSERNGISLVLNFDSKAIDPTSRESVLKGVNKDIVYQRSLNITSYIVKSINGESAANVGSNPPTTGTR
ncbi:MAG: hypothetical protein CMJ76_06165 [Planctomycetaceae bacterium]|nr:hypothetical protein [Planctomycetaceae bacterium]